MFCQYYICFCCEPSHCWIWTRNITWLLMLCFSTGRKGLQEQYFNEARCYESSLSWYMVLRAQQLYGYKARCPYKLFHHYLFMNEYPPTSLIHPWKWPNIFVKHGLGFFIACQISKVNTLSFVFFFLFSFTPYYTENLQELTVDDSRACRGTKI